MKKIPDLVPDEYTRYLLAHICAQKEHEMKTSLNECVPLHIRGMTSNVPGAIIPLPDNGKQYTTIEACSILINLKTSKVVSLDKAINGIINYTPCVRSQMCHILSKFKKNTDIK